MSDVKTPRTSFLVHQKPHALKKKAVIVRNGDEITIGEKSTASNKHTRRTFAGKYVPEEKVLVIGIAGNHTNDAFVRTVGEEIAKERTEKISSYLQSQKKQIVLKDIAIENVRDTFFETIKTLEI